LLIFEKKKIKKGFRKKKCIEKQEKEKKNSDKKRKAIFKRR